MTILVLVITQNSDLHDLVRGKASGLLSPDLRQLAGEPVELASYHIDGTGQIENAKRYAVRAGKDKSGLIVLGENGLVAGLATLADGYLLAPVILDGEQRARLRSLNKTVAKGLRAFEAIRTLNRDGKYGRIIRLPLRNFVAPEMARLAALCAQPLETANFGSVLTALLEEIRITRQTPLRSKRYPKPNYVLVDDRGHQFSFGSEQHSEPDTAAPHTYGCHLRKAFRFGDAIEPWRHYNVTSPVIAMNAHDFIDCHGSTTRCSRTSHANAFPGGFVG